MFIILYITELCVDWSIFYKLVKFGPMLLILPLFIFINMLQPNTTFKTDTPLRDPTLKLILRSEIPVG